MPIVPVAFRVETAQDLEDNLNTLLAPLLTDRIVGVEIDQVKQTPYFAKNLYVALTYETGASTILSPFQFKQFSQPTESNAVEKTQQFIAANPGYFFSQIFIVYRPENPNPEQGVILGIFYSQDPGASVNWMAGGGATFTNPAATPVAVGGIPAGSTFPTPQTMQVMWDRLLYPYLAPAFTAFAISGQALTKEVGDTIPASVTFTWSASNPANVQPNSLAIIDVTGGNVTLASGLANDGSEPLVMGAPITLVAGGSYQFRIDGTNTNAALFSRTLTFSWLWRLFFGVSTNPTLTGLQIGALAGSTLVSAYPGAYACGAGGYKYICQANAAGGQINTVKDQLTSFNVPMATVLDNPAYSNIDGGGFSYALVSYTNVNGITTNYRVYRTANSLGGAVTLVVT